MASVLTVARGGGEWVDRGEAGVRNGLMRLWQRLSRAPL